MESLVETVDGKTLGGNGMGREFRSRVGLGALLILVGGLWLAYQWVPEFGQWVRVSLPVEFSWPLIIVGFGLFLLMAGILTGQPHLAGSSAFFIGLGAIFYWQNQTGRWDTWSYVWTLLPGFAGVGQILTGLLGERPLRSITAGFRGVLISLILFAVFASWLGNVRVFGPWWPALLILLGLWWLVESVLRRK